MQKRLKVLLSAYACESGKGSEPGVGWNWVNQIARFHDVWVITRANNRESIERENGGALSGVRWIYFDYPGWARFWKRGQRGVHLYYYLWQIAVYFLARRLHNEIKFDVAHHLTLGVYWMPSFLSLLPMPFIHGPVGGAESAPGAYHKCFTLRGKVHEWMRNAARRIGEKDPFVLMSIRRAELVLAKVGETGDRVSVLGAKRVEVFPESGIGARDLEEFEKLGGEKSDRFVVISIGRLLHWKGFHMGLKAFSGFVREYPSSEYWFVGDGPERRNLEIIARGLSIADKVRFFGELPRRETLKRLAESDTLVHPSLHDSGGWVCLEAMALGKPVLCLDLGGPGMQVTKETGFKLRAQSSRQTVGDLRDAMIRLAEDSELGRKMGEAARKRVSESFDWDKKGELINKIYQELVA